MSHANTRVSDRSDKPSAGFTPRAFLVGTALSFLLAVGGPYGNMVIRGSYMALDFSTPGALFVFFILVGGINVLFGAIHRKLALSRAELLTVYIMLILASAIPTMGLSEYLFPIISAWSYYATAENQWAELIGPHIKDWLTPQNPDVMKYFYEGLPRRRRGYSTSWGLPVLRT